MVISPIQFGTATDIPLVADWDGDGIGDPTVYRDGNWYMYKDGQSITVAQFGTTGDIPIHQQSGY